MAFTALHAENEARPRSMGYGARIDSVWYRLATAPDIELTILTQDELADRSQTPVNAYSNLYKTGFAWVRGDFTGGEGLDRYPRTPASDLDDTRYFSSANLDLRRPGPGRPFTINLSTRHDPWYTAPGVITDARATVDKLYVAFEDQIVSFDDDDDNSPDTLFTFPAPVMGFDVSDADEGICLLTDGTKWHKPPLTPVWTQVISTELDDVRAVWMVKGRVMAWVKDDASAIYSKLLEVGLGVTGTPAVPSYSVSITVVDTFAADVLAVEDAGICVLAITSDRTVRSYVPRSDTVADPPVLTLVSTSPMPRGEQPVALAQASGQVLILTAHESVMRAYSAVILDQQSNFVLGLLTELRTWEGVVIPDFPMQRLVVSTRDEFRWLVHTDGGDTDLWRYDLVTTGIHNHSTLADHPIEGLVVWADRNYTFTRADTEVARTSVSFCDEGWLITPLVNFNLNADINWTELFIQAFDLLAAGGAQVEVHLSSNDEALLDPSHPSWRLAVRLTSPTVDVVHVPLAGESHPKLALKLVLRSHPGGTGSPRVTQAGMRGIPSAQEVIVTAPISCADQVEAPGRMPVRIPGLGDVVFHTLLELRGRSVDCQVVSPPLRIRGVVTSVGHPVNYVASRGSSGRYCMIEILGQTIAEGASDLGLGGSGVGVGLLGVAQLGTGRI